jgi:hypothetical protein
VSYMLRKRALYNDMSRYCLVLPVMIISGAFLFLFYPLHHLIPIASPCVVGMSVVLAICHVVEGAAKADAQNSVLRLRYVARSFFFACLIMWHGCS